MQVLPQTGDRIRLLQMPDDPNPIPIGELGTVVSVFSHGIGESAWHQVDVEWDHGRGRSMKEHGAFLPSLMSDSIRCSPGRSTFPPEKPPSS